MADRPLNLPESVFIGSCGTYGENMLIATRIKETADPTYDIADRAVVVGRTAADVFSIAQQYGVSIIGATPIKFSDLQKHCAKTGIRFVWDGNQTAPVLERLN